jgi:hypothetical protein
MMRMPMVGFCRSSNDVKCAVNMTPYSEVVEKERGVFCTVLEFLMFGEYCKILWLVGKTWLVVRRLAVFASSYIALLFSYILLIYYFVLFFVFLF